VSHDMKMFLILYGVSMIPYFASCFSLFGSKDMQWGLFFIDLAITISAYVFLVRAIGWWFIPVFIGLYGVGRVMNPIFHPYPVVTAWSKSKNK